MTCKLLTKTRDFFKVFFFLSDEIESLKSLVAIHRPRLEVKAATAGWGRFVVAKVHQFFLIPKGAWHPPHLYKYLA